jgi:nitronate monooxygenase
MRIVTPLTRQLEIEHPVVLAAMDLVADGRLAATVSAAGGFGFIGAGYGDEAWLRRELDAFDALAATPAARRYGVGFITWSLAKQPQLLDLALERRPRAVWLSFGDPAPFVDPIKRAGALLVCQVQTVAMAKDAVAKGADLIVAQGAEAGGHGISRGTIGLVPAVVDAVGPDVPVIAAGGIADGRGLAAALMLGAAGVSMGTRFYATAEAAGSPAAKRRIVEASGDDTVRSIVFDLSRDNVWPAPYTGHCLRNAHAERWLGRELELMQRKAEEVPRYLAARRAGDYDTAAVIAGESADLVRDVPAAAALIERTMAEAVALLSGASRWLGAEAAPRAEAAR